MNHKAISALACLFLLAGKAPVTRAWNMRDHEQVTKVASLALPEQMPRFFRRSADALGHYSGDPDVMKLPATTQLRSGERPEHYLDIELLKGRTLPNTRYQHIALCRQLQIKPQTVGMLPYAVVEHTQRLAVAFAEHRRWPRNPHIQNKCRLYAGLLAHYAQDLCQPLHLTIHWNGRAKADGSSPRTGIHERVDSLLARLTADPKLVAKQLEVQPYDDLFAAILDEMRQSHALVEKVYELEAQLMALDKNTKLQGELKAFAEDRLKKSALVTARLYLTAWEISQALVLPPWDHRTQTGRRVDPRRKGLPALAD